MMHWKHLFWIVPIAFVVGLAFGFASKVYINIPEKVSLEMGYEPHTMMFIQGMMNCSGKNFSEIPSPYVMNVTIKEADDLVRGK